MKKSVLLPLAVFTAGFSGIVLAQANQIQQIDAGVNGKAVRLVITGDQTPSTFCGVRVDWGDGTKDDIKVDSRYGLFPRSVDKIYERNGVYTVSVKGVKVTTHSPCEGSQSVRVTVGGRGDRDRQDGDRRHGSRDDRCPRGWELVSKPNSKTGAYSCKPVMPSDFECADDLKYYKGKNNTFDCRVK